MPALPEDVQRHDDGERRVKDLPTGEHRADQSGEDADRGHHIGHDMLPVGDQRRRFFAPSGTDQRPGPEGVDRRCDAVDGKASPGLFEGTGMLPGPPDLGENQQRRDDDEDAFEHGGEIFGLMVSEGMIPVSRRMADTDRPEGGGGGNHVDDRFQRVGIERDGTRDIPGDELQAEHDQGDDDRPEGEASDFFLGCHAGCLCPLRHGIGLSEYQDESRRCRRRESRALSLPTGSSPSGRVTSILQLWAGSAYAAFTLALRGRCATMFSIIRMPAF